MYGAIQLTGSGAINLSSGCRWVVGATQEAAEQQAEKQFQGKHFTLMQVSSEILFTRSPPSLNCWQPLITLICCEKSHLLYIAG